MLSRVISGLVMAVGIVYVLLGLPWWAFGIVIVLAAAAGSNEYIRMARPDSSSGERARFTLITTCVASTPLLQTLSPKIDHIMVLALGFFALVLARLARPLPIEEALAKLSLELCGLLYLGLTMPLILNLRTLPNGGWWVLLSMVVTFSSDTGGYFAGRFLGRHKLYPAVSPKKTIEGAVGGILAAVGGAYLVAQNVDGFSQLTLLHCLMIGGLGACLAIIGDLAESLMKRAFGVKDSGNLIPGHGGILDRIDGLLFCGPFIWMCWQVMFS
ncbi:MAG: phosphatidate cytidylyltransferase [Bradymonadia bacterium]